MREGYIAELRTLPSVSGSTGVLLDPQNIDVFHRTAGQLTTKVGRYSSLTFHDQTGQVAFAVSDLGSGIMVIGRISGNTTGHNHTHGNLAGLATDDHSQYVYISPSAVDRNAIVETDDVVMLSLQQFDAGVSSNFIEFKDYLGAVVSYVDPQGKVWGAGLDALSQKITSVAAGTAAADAVNYNQLTGATGNLTLWSVHSPTGVTGNPSRRSGEVYFYEDFVGVSNFNTYSSGAGAGSYQTDSQYSLADRNHPGVWRLSAGTAASGHATMYGNTASLLLGPNMYFQSLFSLAGTTTSGLARVGFADVTDNASPGDGLFLEYDQTGSASFYVVSVYKGVKTRNTTTFTPSASVWYNLEIETSKNLSNLSGSFRIDGAGIGSTTTNMPTGTTGDVGMYTLAQSRTTDTYFSLDMDFLRYRAFVSR